MMTQFNSGYLLKLSSSIIIIVLLLQLTPSQQFQLTIVHYNDFHARLLPIGDSNGNECSAEQIEKQQCFGGLARLKGEIEDVRRKYNNTIVLNAGDYFQGTLWFTIYGWRLTAHFLNKLNHTAVAIGSQDFDDGIKVNCCAFVWQRPYGGLYAYSITGSSHACPVVSCNINDTDEMDFQGKYKKKLVTTINGEKVGIIGYVTEKAKFVSSPGALEFNNVIESVSKEAKLFHEEGIKIIIALGHAGVDDDKDLCRDAPYVDVVVGGRTQIFLYKGNPPSDDTPYDTYPIVVKKRSDGKPCLVVTAGAYGKYLGFLQVDFDSGGYPSEWRGNPILLDNTADEDEDITYELQAWQRNTTEYLNEKVGETKVFLDGRAILCRRQECNMGSVIADSMVFAALQFANDFQWNYASLAIVNSGGIRNSIEERKRVNGTVTKGDVLSVLPFRNRIDIIEIKGEYIWQMFEYSVTGYDVDSDYPNPRFIQVSGFRIRYDFCRPSGSRVTAIQARCNECRIPKFSPLDNNSYYQLIAPRFLADGGDGFTFLNEHKLATHSLGFVDSDILIKFMQERGPIVTGFDQRIVTRSGKDCKQAQGAEILMKASRGWMSLLLLLLILTIYD